MEADDGSKIIVDLDKDMDEASIQSWLCALAKILGAIQRGFVKGSHLTVG